MAKRQQPTSVKEIEGDHIAKQTRGWLLPYLLELDTFPGVGHGRWAYWSQICHTLTLPAEPIPQIDFVAPWEMDRLPMPYPEEVMPERPDKHIKRMLDVWLHRGGGWYDDAWLKFSYWLLHGFGKKGMEQEVERIDPAVRNFWYTQFGLQYLLCAPTDWPAYILQSRPSWMGNGKAKWADGTGFYSTPLNVCKLMADMSFHDAKESGVDTRLLTVSDPCCGTGSMLLVASNYSLRLSGQDIVNDLVLQCELNGWLWMPWTVLATPGVDEMFEQLAQQQGTAPQPVIIESAPEPVTEPTAQAELCLEQTDFLSVFD